MMFNLSRMTNLEWKDQQGNNSKSTKCLQRKPEVWNICSSKDVGNIAFGAKYYMMFRPTVPISCFHDFEETDKCKIIQIHVFYTLRVIYDCVLLKYVCQPRVNDLPESWALLDQSALKIYSSSHSNVLKLTGVDRVEFSWNTFETT